VFTWREAFVEIGEHFLNFSSSKGKENIKNPFFQYNQRAKGQERRKNLTGNNYFSSIRFKIQFSAVGFSLSQFCRRGDGIWELKVRLVLKSSGGCKISRSLCGN